MPAATPTSASPACPTPARPGTRPRTAVASATGPGGAEPDAAVVTGGIDGADVEVSVGVQPGTQAGRPVVLLRVTSPLLDTVAAAYLAPDEADRLAAALSAAAFAAAGGGTGAGALPAGAAAPGRTGPAPGEREGHTEITAEEGTDAADLAAAIGLVPAGMVLKDFSADADICLIFDSPAPGGYCDPPGGPAGHNPPPHPIPPWDAREHDNAA
jgi:uncharacterized repeat protein (TIGR03917 family)